MSDLRGSDDARIVSRRRFVRLSANADAGLAVAKCVSNQGGRGGFEPRLITTLGELAPPGHPPFRGGIFDEERDARAEEV